MPANNPSRPLALHFGAGKIGRGFLGQLYFESGFETVFADVDSSLVETINKRGAYPLELAEDPLRIIEIDRVRAVNARDRIGVSNAIEKAGIVSTAVGVRALEQITGVIAEGVRARIDANAPPLNIIVCENSRFAASSLRERVLGAMPAPLHGAVEARIGFVPASIGRMVADVSEAERTDPLIVRAEPYAVLPVDADAIRGELPAIAGAKPVRPFEAELDKKLFMHNGAHAALAYLGRLRGHALIADTLADRRVAAIARGAMEEVRQALYEHWKLDAQSIIDDLWVRFANRALGDTVERVARDPLRKLGPEDRLIGAAKRCVEHGITPRHVCIAAAAGVLYDHPADPAAAELARMRKEEGIDGVLSRVCGLAPDSPIAALIREGMKFLDNFE